MNLLDYLRAAACWFIGHRIVEKPDGQRFCERCKRFVLTI